MADARAALIQDVAARMVAGRKRRRVLPPAPLPGVAQPKPPGLALGLRGLAPGQVKKRVRRPVYRGGMGGGY